MNIWAVDEFGYHYLKPKNNLSEQEYFLLESVAFRLHLEDYERLYEDDITNYKDAYNDAKDDFATGGYLNLVNPVWCEDCCCDISRLFIYDNGAVGAEGIMQKETDDGIEEVEIKLVIELY